MPELKTIEKRNSPQFAAICDALLQRGLKVRFRAQGASMQPNILDGDAVVVAPAACHDLKRGDVALTQSEKGFRVHRVSKEGGGTEEIVTRGDAGQVAGVGPSVRDGSSLPSTGRLGTQV